MPYLGEIRMFACGYAPQGWASCDGQIFNVAQNSALFSIIGNYFGGNEPITFSLPDLRAVLPMGFGEGRGLTPRIVGEKGGSAVATLSVEQMPAHSHAPAAVTPAKSNIVSDNVWSTPGNVRPAPAFYADSLTNPVKLKQDSIASTGQGQPHNNLMPFQVVNICIALQGEYPNRN